MKTHKDLIVWQKSVSFITEIYNQTKLFPKEETYALTSQIRRSAISISANLAEGSGRRNPKELLQFVNLVHHSNAYQT